MASVGSSYKTSKQANELSILHKASPSFPVFYAQGHPALPDGVHGAGPDAGGPI